MGAKVQVLLSTFNGAKYLPALLQSLALQREVDLEVLARDDGSSDQTVSLLLAQQWPQFRVMPGKNLGVVESFFKLLRNSSDEADYFAFCDQDDVWSADKLSRGVQALEGDDGPAIYFSRMTYVDQNLNPVGLSPLATDLTLEHLLVENVAAGCTMVFNRMMRTALLRHGLPDEHALMHDWWLMLVAAAVGRIHFDPMPSILYRQHVGNVVGAKVGARDRVAGFVQRALKLNFGVWHISSQIEEFERRYRVILKPAHAKLIGEFLMSRRAGLWGRLRYAVTMPLRRHSVMGTFLLRLMIVFGRY